MDLYKFAVQNKLRFASQRGELTSEQLYDLPLIELNTIGLAVKKRIADLSVESLIEVTKSDPEKKKFEVALDIVKDIIATKQAEVLAAEDRKAKSIKRTKILDALASKEDAALIKASKADLLRQLDALDSE